MINQDYEVIEVGKYPCISQYIKEIGEIPSIYYPFSCTAKALECFKNFKLKFKAINEEGIFNAVYEIESDVWVEIRMREKRLYSTLYTPVGYEGAKFDEILKPYEWKFKKRTKKVSYVNIIGHDGRGLVMEPFEFKAPKIDLSLNYGERFVEKSNIILKALKKKNSKGIILLHSVPGMGKSTYIKHLLAVIKNKTVIYIPPSMINSIADPTFISFIRDYENSVLILEDAEKVLKSREAGNNNQAAISNLLNLSDGILADCLNIQIVATFNTTKEQIDPALLRKGRLIMRHEFKPLEIAEAQRLADHLKLDIKVNKPMTLADIYNAKDFDSNEEVEVKKIGFGV